jgi:hypothetical protein
MEPVAAVGPALVRGCSLKPWMLAIHGARSLLGPFVRRFVVWTSNGGVAMHLSRTLFVLIAAVTLLISCGGDDASSGDTTPTTTEPATTTNAMPVTTAVATSAPAGPTTVAAATLEQPAIWPAAQVVFATPQEAATDFVRSVLGVAPVLGEYQGGDARSGEIEVFSPGEATPVGRGLLFLRRLGPDDGWFVIGAANPNAAISAPEANAAVPAGPLTVEGVARGFESTVVVTAFLAGDADAVIDQVITSGGALDTPEPYRVTLDLTSATPGDVITLLVRGDTGLETDPGEFGAIPIVIAD